MDEGDDGEGESDLHAAMLTNILAVDLSHEKQMLLKNGSYVLTCKIAINNANIPQNMKKLTTCQFLSPRNLNVRVSIMLDYYDVNARYFFVVVSVYCTPVNFEVMGSSSSKFSGFFVWSFGALAQCFERLAAPRYRLHAGGGMV